MMDCRRLPALWSARKGLRNCKPMSIVVRYSVGVA